MIYVKKIYFFILYILLTASLKAPNAPTQEQIATLEHLIQRVEHAKTICEALNLEPDASEEDMRKAKKQIALQLHSDRLFGFEQNLVLRAQTAFTKINEFTAATSEIDFLLSLVQGRNDLANNQLFQNILTKIMSLNYSPESSVEFFSNCGDILLLIHNLPNDWIVFKEFEKVGGSWATLLSFFEYLIAPICNDSNIFLSYQQKLENITEKFDSDKNEFFSYLSELAKCFYIRMTDEVRKNTPECNPEARLRYFFEWVRDDFCGTGEMPSYIDRKIFAFRDEKEANPASCIDAYRDLIVNVYSFFFKKMRKIFPELKIHKQLCLANDFDKFLKKVEGPLLISLFSVIPIFGLVRYCQVKKRAKIKKKLAERLRQQDCSVKSADDSNSSPNIKQKRY